MAGAADVIQVMARSCRCLAEAPQMNYLCDCPQEFYNVSKLWWTAMDKPNNLQRWPMYRDVCALHAIWANDE